LAKAGLKACPESTSRPAAWDWTYMRRTMWNPTLCKNGKGWGTHCTVSYRKSGKGGPPARKETWCSPMNLMPNVRYNHVHGY